ncbi:GGDEF domain-containing protein [Streptomyces sp. NPDC012693]|uniref:GGDEF domain-containing protein n=1 Tax=Streptomyces sp. NPDC012693 TaxID=3364844 RepID=UPI00367EE32F
MISSHDAAVLNPQKVKQSGGQLHPEHTLGFSHRLVRQRRLDAVITVSPERRQDLIESRHDRQPTAQLQDHFLVRKNHFKAINDRLGHAAGDTVLAAFGARLTAWAGPSAAVGRLGGDEFAVALDLPAARRVQRLEQLVRMLHTPVVLDDGPTVAVAASVGAATPAAVGSRDLSLLQRAADAALYDGKHTGRPVLATAAHATVPSLNGRRLGRPGTAAWGRAA